jgi:hypothetical protein
MVRKVDFKFKQFVPYIKMLLQKDGKVYIFGLSTTVITKGHAEIGIESSVIYS